MTYSVQSPPFVTGTAIVAADHNANWTGVQTYINGIITGANMDANSIGTTQLAPTSVTAAKIATGTITNTEINAAAAIALSKLGLLTGYVSAAGVVLATDTILEAIQKLNGNQSTNAALTGMVTTTGLTNVATVVTNANLTGGVTSVGNAATVVTNANLTGMVTSSGNATTVVTNANLTGPITSVGNATTITDAAVTGTKMFKKVANFSGSYTVATDDYILNHTGGSTGTLTLPNATTYAGRSLQIRNCRAQVIQSATNNIVPLTSESTPRQILGINLILSATDGSWCELVSNGTNWLIVNASELT